MNAFVAAAAGFLLAVLWFDLMFDVQVIGCADGELPESVLASIAAYYARVTTAARPMNRLVAAVMVAMLAALAVEIGRGGKSSAAAGWVSLLIAVPTFVYTGAKIVPNAVRLGARADRLERQSALARSVLRGHVICIAAIASVLIVQLAFA